MSNSPVHRAVPVELDAFELARREAVAGIVVNLELAGELGQAGDIEGEGRRRRRQFRRGSTAIWRLFGRSILQWLRTQGLAAGTDGGCHGYRIADISGYVELPAVGGRELGEAEASERWFPAELKKSMS